MTLPDFIAALRTDRHDYAARQLARLPEGSLRRDHWQYRLVEANTMTLSELVAPFRCCSICGEPAIDTGEVLELVESAESLDDWMTIVEDAALGADHDCTMEDDL